MRTTPGISVAFTESMQPTQSDCTDGMTKASTQGVDFIDFELDVGHTIPCVLSAQEENYKPAHGWGGYLIGVPATPQGIGAYSVGMWAVDAFAPIYSNQTYLQAVRNVNPQVEAVSSPTAGMYTAAWLMASGIQQLGNDITRQRLRSVINTFLPMAKSLHFKVLKSASNGNVVFNERIDVFDLGNGKTISLPVAGVRVVEATKQVYRAIPAKRERTRLIPALEPVLVPSSGLRG